MGNCGTDLLGPLYSLEKTMTICYFCESDLYKNRLTRKIILSGSFNIKKARKNVPFLI